MSLIQADNTQPSERYTVIVRGQLFHLSKPQITFDSPNLFTRSFLGDFSEANSRKMELDSSPDIFAIITDYLSGYQILPLDDSMLPRRISVEAAMRYLSKDADYLGLTRLQEFLATPRRAFQEWANTVTYGIDLVDVLKNSLPASVQWKDEPTQLVDISENGKQVCVIARNVALRLVKSGESMCPSSDAGSKQLSHDVFWITHLEGIENLPLMYGAANLRATVMLDDNARIFVDDFKSYFSTNGYSDAIFGSTSAVHVKPADRASKHYYDFVNSPERSIWASHALFSVHGRDVLDSTTQWRHWDIRLISVRGKSNSVAIEHALLGGEL